MTTRIVFITGTDTGVGKTVLTSLLLSHLQAQGANVLALKPFCSGGRDDAQLLHRLQDGALTLDEINPFYFPEPVAPLVSARKHSRSVSLDRVLKHIEAIAAKVSAFPSSIKNSKLKTKNYLLIEGSGGLLVPLGERYTVRDLISRLACDVLVVSRNQLGTINHTLLTLEALGVSTRARTSEIPHSALRPPHSEFRTTPHSALPTPHSVGVVLMHTSKRDPSCRTNPLVLSQLLPRIPLQQLPFLGRHRASASFLRKAADDLRRRLAQLI